METSMQNISLTPFLVNFDLGLCPDVTRAHVSALAQSTGHCVFESTSRLLPFQVMCAPERAHVRWQQ